ncbi:MAG: hypothetical protein QOG54_1473 [Actinomycetota bacterium]|jgi:hypothetical protein|nr:hypothetical protein [Actinomycetota bacterium]
MGDGTKETLALHVSESRRARKLKGESSSHHALELGSRGLSSGTQAIRHTDPRQIRARGENPASATSAFIRRTHHEDRGTKRLGLLHAIRCIDDDAFEARNQALEEIRRRRAVVTRRDKSPKTPGDRQQCALEIIRSPSKRVLRQSKAISCSPRSVEIHEARPAMRSEHAREVKSNRSYAATARGPRDDDDPRASCSKAVRDGGHQFVRTLRIEPDRIDRCIQGIGSSDAETRWRAASAGELDRPLAGGRVQGASNGETIRLLRQDRDLYASHVATPTPGSRGRCARCHATIKGWRRRFST